MPDKIDTERVRAVLLRARQGQAAEIRPARAEAAQEFRQLLPSYLEKVERNEAPSDAWEVRHGTVEDDEDDD